MPSQLKILLVNLENSFLSFKIHSGTENLVKTLAPVGTPINFKTLARGLLFIPRLNVSYLFVLHSLIFPFTPNRQEIVSLNLSSSPIDLDV